MVRKKRGYLRTLEVIIAMVITFAFVLHIIPAQQGGSPEKTKKALISLMENEEFRAFAMNITGCVSKGENNSINTILEKSLNDAGNYYICQQGTLPTLPRKRVNAESLYLTGNITNREDKVLKLYYWE